MQQNAYAETEISVFDSAINFKPSPNFKNMKKFLKQRTGTAVDSNILDSPESTPQQEDVKPPLPLKSPPPDDISTNHQTSPSESFNNEQLLLCAPNMEYSSSEHDIKYDESPIDHVQEKSKPNTNVDPICKDFIRGTCSRVACRYRHEIDKSQLRGIFIFCHNYQNYNKCLKPDCKYVHADVFEEQEFYRSGKLPKVLREKSQAPPLPPPEEESSKEVTSTFVVPNCPPPFVSKEEYLLSGLFNNNISSDPKSPRLARKGTCSDSDEGSLDGTSCGSPGETLTKNCKVMENREDFLLSSLFNNSMSSDSKSPRPARKRTWSDSDDSFLDLLSYGSPEDNLTKRLSESRCTSCKVMENRLKFAMDRLREIRKSAENSEKKMMQLQKKHKFLLQLAMASARLNERENTNINQSSIFPQMDFQNFQQSTAMAESLSNFEMFSLLEGHLSSQRKNVMQAPIFNKINNIDDNKAYQLSTQQLAQLQTPPNSNAQFQSSSVNTISNDQNSVRLADMSGPSRQLSNLRNRW